MYYSRKCPRLEGYDYSQENIVYATICVMNRRKLLGEVHAPATAGEAPWMELSPAGKIVEKYTSTIPGIDKYAIMPNHVHLILALQDTGTSCPNVSRIIRQLKGVITKRLGKNIWQIHFYDHVIRNEQDYREIWQYIDNNPTKWSLDRYYTS